MRKFLFALLAAPLLFGACSDDNDESTPTLSFAKPVLALSTGSVTLDLQVSGVDLSSLASPVTVPVAFSGTAVKGPSIPYRPNNSYWEVTISRFRLR